MTPSFLQAGKYIDMKIFVVNNLSANLGILETYISYQNKLRVPLQTINIDTILYW